MAETDSTRHDRTPEMAPPPHLGGALVRAGEPQLLAALDHPDRRPVGPCLRRAGYAAHRSRLDRPCRRSRRRALGAGRGPAPLPQADPGRCARTARLRPARPSHRRADRHAGNRRRPIPNRSPSGRRTARAWPPAPRRRKAVSPDLALASRDPFALRYVALTALVIALLFGSIWRASSVTALTPGGGGALANGPVWEGWAQPPAYTGKPSLYLNDITQAQLELPVGTRIQIRLYGEVGALTLSETVSNRTEVPAASDPAQDFDVAKSGAIEIAGPGGRTWEIAATPDNRPTIAPAGEITREEGGEMKPALHRVRRLRRRRGAGDHRTRSARHRPPLRPGGRTPSRASPSFSTCPCRSPASGPSSPKRWWTMSPSTHSPTCPSPSRWPQPMRSARPARPNRSRSTLPGRRFFDPLAAALIETRRDLLWSTANAKRSSQILKAVTHKPEGFIRNERAYLRLRVLMRNLDSAAATTCNPPRGTRLPTRLWEIALLVEEGDLASALERLRRAQDRLDEAIKNGADQSEIDQLMSELREALERLHAPACRRIEEEPRPADVATCRGCR